MDNQPERPWEDDDPAKEPSGANSSGGCLWIVGICIVIFIGWYAFSLGTSDSDADEPSTSGAEVACERAIKERVADAKIDSQRAVPMSSRRIIVSGYVTDSSGLRAHFSCDGITSDGGDSWQSSKVKIGD